MKNNMKRISILLIVLSLTLTFLMIGIKATKAATTTLSASSASVTSGESFSINITSSTKLSGWTITLTDSDKCTFSSATGGEVSGKSVYGTSQTGANTLAKYTFKAPIVDKDTTYTIKFSGSDMADATNDVNIVNNASCSTKITVKAKTTGGSSSGGSSSGSSGSSGNTAKPKTPSFTTKNQKIYTKSDCNLRASWTTSSAATSVKKGTELTLTGTSTETIDGYTWYRVTYQGSTKYIASSLITYTKPDNDKEDDENKDDDKNEKSSNKNLSSLKIEGIEITPAFDKDTTQYTAQVEGDVTELKIDAKAEHSKAKVTVEGNKNLKEGDNVIKVKVTAEDETTRTYFITVTQGEGTDVDTGLKLAELKIERVDFEGIFKPDVHSYDLDLTSYVKKLDITATPNQPDATVEISGNEEFKEGQNVIVILLTSADGSETANYQIKVNVPAEVIEKAEEPDTTFYILIGIAVAVVLIAIILIIKRHRSTRDEYADDEFEEETEIRAERGRRFSDYEDRDEPEEENSYQERETRRAKKSDVTLDDFLNAPDDDDDTPRGARGRHSR